MNRDIPFTGINWFFDHAETISDRNIDRIARLGGGIAVQHRMAFQGEYFIDRYGKEAAEQSPPISRMLKLEVPVGAGTDGTRVASYNPWVSLYWLVSGKTVGGTLGRGRSRSKRPRSRHVQTRRRSTRAANRERNSAVSRATATKVPVDCSPAMTSAASAPPASVTATFS